MTLRAMGPFNGTLPIPTGMVIGFMRNPKRLPYLKYTQLVPAPENQFMFFRIDPDEPTRLPAINEYGWAYDDYRPSGRDFTLRGDWTADRVQRWDFAYQIGDTTMRVWNKHGINPKMLYDEVRASQAATHRAQRIFTALVGASYTSNWNSSDLNVMLNTVNAFWDQSSGVQYDPNSGAVNPNFQVIKKTFQMVNRRIHLQTNGASDAGEVIAVIPPVVAQQMAISGEMVDYLKQSPYAKELISPDMKRWGLPEEYEGIKIVVEDTVRTFQNQIAAGTVADVTLSAQKDYIFNTDDCYFVSRIGGLDGGYGFRNFSTVQLYHLGGEARVEAFSDPENELTKGHIVMEDKAVIPTTLGAFKLTHVLSATNR